MLEPRLRLSIGTHAVGLVTRPGLYWLRAAPAAQSWLSLDTPRCWEQAVLELLGQQASRDLRRIEVVVDDAYLRWFDSRAPVGTQSPEELRTATTLRFENLFECDASKWILRADWSAQERYAACALPTDFRDRLDRLLQAQHCAIRTLRSALVDRLRHLPRYRENTWLVLRSREQSWVAGIRAKRLLFVQAQAAFGLEAPPFTSNPQPLMPATSSRSSLVDVTSTDESSRWPEWVSRYALWRDVPLPRRLYVCDETISPLPSDSTLPLWQLPFDESLRVAAQTFGFESGSTSRAAP